MIPASGPPRSELTATEIRQILVDADTITVSGGLDVLDEHDEVIAEDVAIDAASCTVSRDVTAELHLSGSFTILQELAWEWVRLRPWIEVSAEVLSGDAWVTKTARFMLGVLLPSTPSRTLGEYLYGHDGVPETSIFQVEGYDKLHLLNVPIEDTISIGGPGQGTDVMSFIEELIATTGETKVRLNHDADGVYHATGTFWSPSDDVTILAIVNELLEHVAYTPLSVDVDGWFVANPLLPVSERPVEWTYSTDDDRSTVQIPVTLENDLFSLPNRFVFVNDTEMDREPVEGNGVYTRVNQNSGVGSVDGRRRRVTGVFRVSVANQTKLEEVAVAQIEELGRSAETVTMQVALNPLHWGFPSAGDVIELDATSHGLNERFEVTAWTLPMDGNDMQLTCRLVAPSFQTVPEEWA